MGFPCDFLGRRSLAWLRKRRKSLSPPTHDDRALKRGQEKWEPVFRPDARQTRNRERDAKKSHPALDDRRAPTVDVDRGTGHVGTGVGGKEASEIGELFGLSEAADRDLLG